MADNTDTETGSEDDSGPLAVFGSAARTVVPAALRRRYLAKFGVGLLVVVLAIALVGGNAYVQTSTALDQQVKSELTTGAEREATELSEWRVQRSRWVRLLSEASAFQNDVTIPIRNYLQNEIKNIPSDVYRLHYVDTEQMEIVTSSNTRYEETDLTQTNATWTDRDFSSVNSDDVVVSDVYWTGGEPSIAFISPIPQKSGFVLVAVMDAQSVVTEFDKSIQGSFTQVVDRNGTVVMDQRGTRAVLGRYITGRTASSIPEITRASANQTGFRKQASKNDRFVSAYAPVNGSNWIVVTHAPEQRAYLVRSQITNNLLSILLVSLVGLGLIGVTLGRGTVRALNRLTSKAHELEDGNLEVELESTRIDEIGELFDAFANMRDSLRQQITEARNAKEEATEAKEEAEKARVDADKAREEAEQMSQHLEQKAQEFNDAMKRCAEGDLTERLDDESRSEAMVEIAEAFNTMIDDIERTIATVVDFANEVSDSSGEVKASAAEVRETSEEVSKSIQRISDFAVEQNDQMETVSNELQQMSATIEEVASSADEVAETSKRARELGEEGKAAAADVVEEMESIESRAENTLEEIRTLDDEMEKIGEIVNVITDIAEQTNILALNANIEAAHSGGEGEGFAVVADEVKQLAEETKTSAEEIEDLVERVQSQTSDTVEEMESMRDSVIEGAETVEGSVSAFDGIAEQVEEADTGVQDISSATNDLASSVEEVASMADDVAEMSSKSADEANNVAGAAEEQTASITEVSTSASHLSERSERLRDLLGEFQTATEIEAGDGQVGAHPDGGEHDTDETQDDTDETEGEKTAVVDDETEPTTEHGE